MVLNFCVAILLIVSGICEKLQIPEVDMLSNCHWVAKDTSSPEIFWINLDSSTDRKAKMQFHLDGLNALHRRVRGVSMDDIFVPKDVERNWNQHKAIVNSKMIPPPNSNLVVDKYRIILSGLYGRRKTNRLKEVGCTASHLVAMHEAIFNNKSSSRYAVITEDDIQFVFDMNFTAMALTAPPGFGILQLFNSNEESMQDSWKRYLHKNDLWIERYPGMAGSYWSTCAYLIDREVMRPLVADLLTTRSDGLLDLKLIASVMRPCGPKLSQCCHNETRVFMKSSICIYAPKGFQADSFLYAMTRSLITTAPLITNGFGGNQSTFHQDHVEDIHQQAFARQRQYINAMQSGRTRLPSFASKACDGLISTKMTVKKRPECSFTNRTQQVEQPIWYWLNHPADSLSRGIMQQKLTVAGLRHEMITAAVTSTGSATAGSVEDDDDDLILPDDVRSSWATKWCTLNSSVSAASLHKAYTASHRGMSKTQTPSLISQAMPTSAAAAAAVKMKMTSRRRSKYLIMGLCGRGKGRNSLPDLAVTLSHLLAIHTAVHSPQSTSRYAVICSDDIHLPFDMDVNALAQTAPEGFGMLQLITAHELHMERMWIRYIRDNTEMWLERNPNKFYDEWGAKAYIIDRLVMQPIVDSMLQEFFPSASTSSSNSNSNSGSGSGSDSSSRWWSVRLAAGLAPACVPNECCQAAVAPMHVAQSLADMSALLTHNSLASSSSTSSSSSPTLADVPSSVIHNKLGTSLNFTSNGFMLHSPCVHQTQGFIAETFLMSLSKSYSITVPMVLHTHSFTPLQNQTYIQYLQYLDYQQQLTEFTINSTGASVKDMPPRPPANMKTFSDLEIADQQLVTARLSARDRQKLYINDMLKGLYPVPKHVRSGCITLVS